MNERLLLGQSDYLHHCLGLFASVTEVRYGRRQRLEAVERDVADRLAARAQLWAIVHTIRQIEPVSVVMRFICFRT